MPRIKSLKPFKHGDVVRFRQTPRNRDQISANPTYEHMLWVVKSCRPAHLEDPVYMVEVRGVLDGEWDNFYHWRLEKVDA